MVIDYLKFFLAFIFFFLLPGFSVLYLVVRPKIRLTSIEYLVFSLGISISLVNFCVLFLNKLGISLDTSHLVNTVFFVIALPLVVSTFPSLKTTFVPVKKNVKKKEVKEKSKQLNQPLLDKLPPYARLRRKHLLSVLLLTGLSLFILVKFLAADIVPNNTDLGHHMYWAELMKEQGKIPNYDTSDVVVGEHIPFAVLARTTEVSLLSALPVIFLLFVNLASFLALSALAIRVCKSQLIGWVVFLLVGILYVVADPFGKFVSGGVVGNVMGNLFFPLVFLAVFLAVTKKKKELMAIGIFLFSGIFYIHHLSTFLLGFVLLGGFFLHLILNLRIGKLAQLKQVARNWLGLAFSPLPLLALVIFLGFLSCVYTPHYVSSKAVETVVEAPTKETHQGVTLASFFSSIGEWRVALGFLGLITWGIIFIKKKRIASYSFSFLGSWTLTLLLLSFYPGFLLVDLPSRRVVNYLIAPLALLGGFFLVKFFGILKNKLDGRLFGLVFFTFSLALLLNGYGDSLKYFRLENQFKETVQVYHAAQYLAPRTSADDVILKDHANLPADNWLKFFFLRGYDYFLSRTFDYKYEDPNNKREVCTRDMAIAPDSSEGLACYKETGTGYVILKKDIDNYFYDWSDNFSKIYESDGVVIYKRKS